MSTRNNNHPIPIAVACRMIAPAAQDAVLDPRVVRDRGRKLGLLVTCPDGRAGLPPDVVAYFSQCYRAFGKLTPRGGGRFSKEKIA